MKEIKILVDYDFINYEPRFQIEDEDGKVLGIGKTIEEAFERVGFNVKMDIILNGGGRL